ncbi:MAG TPA: hypothetical protein VHC44_01355, partial [Verrucomicrobiae bacterium]|nr:hypothetical protein [Verrucomicrobiae bacterium]
MKTQNIVPLLLLASCCVIGAQSDPNTIATTQAKPPQIGGNNGAEVVTLTNVPASREIRLAAGQACILRLPGGKTVALWCAQARGIPAVLDDGDLTFDYGEEPFKELKSEEIRLPGGGVTYGEYLSYIRQGPVISTDHTREYVLYVDNYALSIVNKDRGESGKALDLTISIRQATGKEIIPPKQEREHYLQALHSTDPKIRLEAIQQLGEMVSLGSIYAGNHLEIADAIRPFLKDE